MKNLVASLKIFALLTLLCGVVYPLVVTLAARVIAPAASEGSLLRTADGVRGAKSIAQKFEKEGYFWPRPSSVDYNASNSGGSNLSPDSQALLKLVTERREKWRAVNEGEPPAELLFASGSGLDPDISPEAALAQVPRIARARAVDAGALQRWIRQVTVGPQFGILGQSRVNVLELNLALDAGDIH